MSKEINSQYQAVVDMLCEANYQCLWEAKQKTTMTPQFTLEAWGNSDRLLILQKFKEHGVEVYTNETPNKLTDIATWLASDRKEIVP